MRGRYRTGSSQRWRRSGAMLRTEREDANSETTTAAAKGNDDLGDSGDEIDDSVDSDGDERRGEDEHERDGQMDDDDSRPHSSLQHQKPHNTETADDHNRVDVHATSLPHALFVNNRALVDALMYNQTERE